MQNSAFGFGIALFIMSCCELKKKNLKFFLIGENECIANRHLLSCLLHLAAVWLRSCSSSLAWEHYCHGTSLWRLLW